MKDFIQDLFKSVGCKSYESILMVKSVKNVDSFIDKKLSGEKFACFMCIEEDSMLTMFQFWRLVQNKVLDPDSFVVFLDVKDCPCWVDLVKIYGGLKFGSLFLLKTSKGTNPGVVPSQRGIFLNRESKNANQ